MVRHEQEDIDIPDCEQRAAAWEDVLGKTEEHQFPRNSREMSEARARTDAYSPVPLSTTCSCNPGKLRPGPPFQLLVTSSMCAPSVSQESDMVMSTRGGGFSEDVFHSILLLLLTQRSSVRWYMVDLDAI